MLRLRYLIPLLVLVWTALYFYSLSSLEFHRPRLFPTSEEKPSHVEPPTEPPTPRLTEAPSGPLVIPKVPVMDELPPRYLGKNRTFSHPYWEIFPAPRLVNFPENGKFLEAALNTTTNRDRVIAINTQPGGFYSLAGAAPFPADCPFKCTFGSGSDVSIASAPIMCAQNQLSIVFGLESSVNSWWRDEQTYRQCSFTMRSHLSSTIPMLGQVKSFMPIDLDTGRLLHESLPLIPYEVKKTRRMLTAVLSNCVAHRLQLLDKFQELGVSVSQYGNCASGERGEPIPYEQLDELQSGLLKQLSGDRFTQKESMIASSLFHFAAENSICDFYHTEKLFGALKIGTVPVYFGARTIYPYLPENSTIFVYDFDNIYALVDHLKTLAANPALYNQYLEWRKKPLPEPLMDILVVGHGERSSEWQCELCKLVSTTPPGYYEQPYDDCEEFPLQKYFEKDFKLTKYVKEAMVKVRPGGRRW